MVWTKRLRQGAFVAILMLPLLLAACMETNGAIDPPPKEVEAKMLEAVDSKGSVAEATIDAFNAQQLKANMIVYIQDRHGYLIPISYQWNSEDPAVLAQASADILVKEGIHAKRLPPGFVATLPKGTSIKVILKPEKKMALVELSKQFATYNKEDERKIMESITWSLTSQPNVEQIQLWMDSKKLKEMPIDHTPINDCLTRQIGINLEKESAVNYLHSMSTTLYFSSYNEEGKAYFVPITRLVESSSDPIRTTLEQMIIGPSNNKVMNRVLTQETKINNIVASGDTLTVDLADSMFAKGDQIPAELLKAVLLSLTEQQEVKKVQVKINGVADIQGTDKLDYSVPVPRPVVNIVLEGVNAFY